MGKDIKYNFLSKFIARPSSWNHQSSFRIINWNDVYCLWQYGKGKLLGKSTAVFANFASSQLISVPRPGKHFQAGNNGKSMRAKWLLQCIIEPPLSKFSFSTLVVRSIEKHPLHAGGQRKCNDPILSIYNYGPWFMGPFQILHIHQF